MIVPREIAGAVLRVDLDAIAANYRALRALAEGATVAGVVKADGYGLGAPEVASALAVAGCRTFFVAHLCEALSLRSHIPTDAALFILNGLPPGAEQACADANAIPVLNAFDQLERWAALATARGERLPAALQIDSGMSRLGLPADEVARLLRHPERLAAIDVRLVMSHLACADDAEAEANARQYDEFAAICSSVADVPRSLDNSGGIFLPRQHLELVRPGIALYGGRPQAGIDNPMRQVVSLQAKIVQVRTIAPGTGVGYGLTFRADRLSRIATIGVGYADGWPRHLSGIGAGYIDGHRVPIAGRVSMDSITLDVTDIPDRLLHPGALVELLGSHQTIDDVAAQAGTISYEILTQLGHRYAREYLPVRADTTDRSEMS